MQEINIPKFIGSEPVQFVAGDVYFMDGVERVVLLRASVNGGMEYTEAGLRLLLRNAPSVGVPDNTLEEMTTMKKRSSRKPKAEAPVDVAPPDTPNTTDASVHIPDDLDFS